MIELFCCAMIQVVGQPDLELSTPYTMAKKPIRSLSNEQSMYLRKNVPGTLSFFVFILSARLRCNNGLN